jgi:hypothetical protein
VWVAAAAVVVIAAAAAVVVPMLRDEPAGVSAGPVPAATANGPGQLQWRARGPLAGDGDFLRAALRTWQDRVLDRQRPTRAAVLWAGPLDGARTALLQGTDGTGQSWAAEIRDDAGATELRSTEPLGRAVPLLALGAADQLRLLAAPDAAGGLLVADGGRMRALTVEADGLSEPLAAPPGGIRVALTDGGAVTGSGTVLAGRLSPVTGTVELARPALEFGAMPPVDPVWYEDGARVARRLGGSVEVAQVGPTRGTTLRVGPARLRLEARSYEVVHAGTRYLATVVRVGGAPACTDAVAVGPADAAPTRPPVLVSRCIPHGATDGVLAAVGTGGVRSVRVTVAPPTRASPARPGSPAKPARAARVVTVSGSAGTGLVGLAGVPGLPTRAAPVVAVGAGDRPLARLTLAPYRGPRP